MRRIVGQTQDKSQRGAGGCRVVNVGGGCLFKGIPERMEKHFLCRGGGIASFLDL